MTMEKIYQVNGLDVTIRDESELDFVLSEVSKISDNLLSKNIKKILVDTRIGWTRADEKGALTDIKPIGLGYWYLSVTT
jgi:hypothetical protein